MPLNKYQPHHCFVYPHCSSLICPFDRDWKKRHYKNESVCRLLRESQKEGADLFFQTYFSDGLQLLEEIRNEAIPQMIEQHPILKEKLYQVAQNNKEKNNV